MWMATKVASENSGNYHSCDRNHYRTVEESGFPEIDLEMELIIVFLPDGLLTKIIIFGPYMHEQRLFSIRQPVP
ncbi:hypothetical protein V6N13_055144 [Hibiscus sabdariffa]